MFILIEILQEINSIYFDYTEIFFSINPCPHK